MKGSSAQQRTLSFAKYLPAYGWRPLILSVHPRAYPERQTGQANDIPADTVVKRAFALDSARHLAIKGSYARFTAYPDRWSSWWLGGTLSGLRLIWRYRPQLIWSTFPIATAHLIGLSLNRLTGVPWISDFRDPMGQDNYPPHPMTRKLYWSLERRTIERSACCVFTAPGAAWMYAERYPGRPDWKWQVIENGYDEPSFAAAERLAETRQGSHSGCKLVHSGLLYPMERDPSAFFLALRELNEEGLAVRCGLQIVLRASGYEEHYQKRLQELGLEGIVHLEPALPYTEALAEMIVSDGLLLFQGPGCNEQIPAKVYEYLRTGKPILAFTDPEGDTARLLQGSGQGLIARLDSTEELKTCMQDFAANRDAWQSNPAKDIPACSRRKRAAELADLFQKVLQYEGRPF